MTVECANCLRPVPDSLTLCNRCGATSANLLLSIPSLVDDLATTRAGLGRVIAPSSGGRSAETALPISSAARDDDDHCGAELVGDRQLAALENTVTGWARLVAEDMGACIYVGGPALVDLAVDYRTARLDAEGRPVVLKGAPDPGALLLVPITAVEQAAVWLAQQRHTLRAHQAAYELLRDVGRIVGQIRRIVDAPPELHYVGACPGWLDEDTRCGHELRAEREATWIRCPRCGIQLEVAALLHETLASADNMLVSVDEALALLDRVGDPLPIGTFRSWVSRHRIEPRRFRRPSGQIVEVAVRRDDEPMYLFGEIRELQLAGKRHALETGRRR